MFRPALTVVVGAALAAGTGAWTVSAEAKADAADAGPPYEFSTEIVSGTVVPLKGAAMITRSEHGYVYHSGQQDGHLTVTKVGDELRFHDTRTARIDKLVAGCRELSTDVGVAAACSIPDHVTVSRPLLLEVWPRLGHDYTDGRTLPATVAMAVLGDAGDDIAHLGAGPDFFNGAFGVDRVTGGGGSDWLRTGQDADKIRGGGGDDRLMGVDGNDTIRGGGGDDRVGGDQGNDRLFAGSGADLVVCGDGSDDALIDSGDSARECESVARR